MSNEYEIVTLRDILNIPEDKFDVFVTDLKMWHSSMKHLVELLDVTASAVGKEEVEVKISKMVWIDDGKHNATLRIAKYDPNTTKRK